MDPERSGSKEASTRNWTSKASQVEMDSQEGEKKPSANPKYVWDPT